MYLSLFDPQLPKFWLLRKYLLLTVTLIRIAHNYINNVIKMSPHGIKFMSTSDVCLQISNSIIGLQLGLKFMNKN